MDEEPAAIASPPADRAAMLAEEDRLWAGVLATPEADDAHREYFNFVTRNGLLREGLRRYSPLVEAKDDFSIESRRQFRRYQQTLMNLMFMTGPRPPSDSGRNNLEYLGLYLAAFVGIAGLVIPGPIPKILVPIGFGFVGFSLYRRYRRVSEKPPLAPGVDLTDTEKRRDS
ncbi:MAG: hypothetical protein KJ042_15175 [Deltaproteobacteria bacterium]|nr:hypothetical protein [Deltaproteobacteria bacterium]